MLLKKIVIVTTLLMVSLLYSTNSSLLNSLTTIVDEAEEKKSEDREFLDNVLTQRMRIEKIIRDVLLVKLDINSTLYTKEFLMESSKFDFRLKNTRETKKSYVDEISKKVPNFKQHLKEFSKTWDKFFNKIKILSKDHSDKKAWEYIINNNHKIKKDIEYLFLHFLSILDSKNKFEESMLEIENQLLFKIGKPRMYITQIVKERLLIASKINVLENKKRLENSIKDMDKLMLALKEGDKELKLSGTENREILEKLASAQQIWEELKKAVSHKEMDKKDILKIIELNNNFLYSYTIVVNLVLMTLNDI